MRNVYVLYVGQDIRALEQQLASTPAPGEPPPDPKIVEALTASVKLAKALTLVAA